MYSELPFVTGMALNAYLPAEQGIVRAHGTGCSHWYIDTVLETDGMETWTAGRLDALKLLIHELQVRPIVHGNFKAPLSSNIKSVQEGALAHARQEVDLASELNAPLIVHGGAIVEPRLEKQAREDALQHYLESLEMLHEYTERRGVQLWVENLANFSHYAPFYYVFTRLVEFEHVLTRLPNVKFIFDVGHANIDSEAPFSGFESFSHRIVALSLSNNDGHKDRHRPLPYGTVDYPALIRLILERQWEGLIVFETRGREPDESLRDLEKLYRGVLAEGRE